MALAVVGGALLSAFLDVLFERLASPEFVNFIRGKKPDKLLQKIKSQLLVVKVVLADAEKKQITDSNVKEWLDLLTDVVYEVDDLLDEVSTKAAAQNEVSNSFSRLLNRKKIVSISKLEGILERLDDILKQKKSLDLKEIPVESNQSWKAQPTSQEDRYVTYGRDKDKELIMKLVLEDNSDEEEVSVIPICHANLVNLRHLQIFNIPIKEMPKRMGKLNQLQKLDFYIVGKHKENSIKELGGLPNLHGNFSIKELENVIKSEEALEARIMDKKHIDILSLEWSIGNYNGIDFEIELDVLSNLQPHHDLKALSISGYKGTRFPEWVESFSYQNITDLYLENCNNCCSLPSLGQLPSLMDLSDMNSVKTIDADFYKKEDCSSVTPFPSLQYLCIEGMPCWEVWSSVESEAFPVLEDLYIRNCPKLKGDLPNHLPALQTLSITNCELLASSVPRAPTLQTLQISKSNKVAFHVFPLSVKDIEIEGSPMVESMMEAINNFQPTCLRFLSLNNCSSAISFPGSESFKSLSFVHISNCPNFVSFPGEGLSAPNLTRLIVNDCEKLKSLPDQMGTLLPKMEQLDIWNCQQIESFPGGSKPPNLITVVIRNCEKLVSGQAWLSMDMVTSLEVWGPCDGINSFPKEGLLPPSLKFLYLSELSSLETLECKGLLHLTSLQELEIEKCEKLENIGGERLPVVHSLLPAFFNVLFNRLVANLIRGQNPEKFLASKVEEPADTKSQPHSLASTTASSELLRAPSNSPFIIQSSCSSTKERDIWGYTYCHQPCEVPFMIILKKQFDVLALLMHALETPSNESILL
ncbi:hypothetical protein VNO80_01174 [Phaseolus coccineus]|uniref:Rx N-terminal domain-containing protein n=1 Tax=Phaseolus coccineus TaxID=3886 RepID=A0AAN9RSI6_PHACN